MGLAYSGIDIFWTASAYDGMRIYQFFLFLSFSLYFFTTEKIIIPHSKKLYAILFAILILQIITSISSKNPIRSFNNLIWNYSILSYILCLFNIFKNNKETRNFIFLTLPFLPIFTAFFLPISIFNKIKANTFYDWHQSFLNIRMFDDALIISFFLLLHLTETRKINNKIIIFLTSFYFFCLLIDGARAAIFSMITSLFITTFIKNKASLLKTPLLSIIISLLLYIFFQNLGEEKTPNSSSSLIRTGSSGRIEIWIKALNSWENNFFFGIGGDHFSIISSSTDIIPVAHPHNLFFLLTSEWGVGGLVLFLLMCYIFFYTVKKNHNIPFFILSCFICITINSFFSNTTYPTSQIPNSIIIALTFSYLKNPSIRIKNFFIPLILITYILLFYKSDIFIAHPNNPISPYPRFWHDGHNEHLK